MQSVSDDDVRKRLPEQPRFERLRLNQTIKLRSVHQNVSFHVYFSFFLLAFQRQLQFTKKHSAKVEQKTDDWAKFSKIDRYVSGYIPITYDTIRYR